MDLWLWDQSDYLTGSSLSNNEGPQSGRIRWILALLLYGSLVQIIILIFQAYNLLGQFLLLNKDEETFQEWLKDEAEMNSKYAKDVSNCISEWTRSYV